MIKQLLLIILMVCASLMLKAQGYTFSVEQQNYSNIFNATSLTNGATWDDPIYSIPIGFNFELYNTQMDTIYISFEGLGGFLSSTNQLNGEHPFLCAYGADIIDRGYDFNIGDAPAGGLSKISYVETGILGNRILKIEWQNAGFYSDIDNNGVSTDYVNFQLWLYEGSGNIEIHMGSSSITQPGLSYDGESGSYTGICSGYDLDNDTITGSGLELVGGASNPSAQAMTDPYMNFMNGDGPNGTVYKFSRTLVGLNEYEAHIDFSMHPNPTKDVFTLELADKYQKDVRIEITNQMGQTVRLIEQASFDNNKLDVEVSSLAQGIYFVTLNSTDRMATRRLAKD